MDEIYFYQLCDHDSLTLLKRYSLICLLFRYEIPDIILCRTLRAEINEKCYIQRRE